MFLTEEARDTSDDEIEERHNTVNGNHMFLTTESEELQTKYDKQSQYRKR